jgi:hypothetical protein
MASGARTAATITVRFRTAPNVDVSAVSLVDADADVLAAAWPWREFRWRAGQKHYSAVIGRRPRVAMSSMSRGWSSPGVLFADFDRSVHRICAQPFLLVTRSHGRMMKIIP